MNTIVMKIPNRRNIQSANNNSKISRDFNNEILVIFFNEYDRDESTWITNTKHDHSFSTINLT